MSPRKRFEKKYTTLVESKKQINVPQEITKNNNDIKNNDVIVQSGNQDEI